MYQIFTGTEMGILEQVLHVIPNTKLCCILLLVWIPTVTLILHWNWTLWDTTEYRRWGEGRANVLHTPISSEPPCSCTIIHHSEKDLHAYKNMLRCFTGIILESVVFLILGMIWWKIICKRSAYSYNSSGPEFCCIPLMTSHYWCPPRISFGHSPV